MVSTYTTVSELEPDSMGFMHKKVFVRRLALFLKVHRCIFIISPTSRRFISNSLAIAESWLMVDRIDYSFTQWHVFCLRFRKKNKH